MPTYVLVTLGSSLCFACGMTLQKSVVAERGLRDALRSPAWRLGLGIIALAGALQAIAISLGNVSIVKPLGLLQCVFALGLGVLLLQERLGRAEAIGACAVVAGGVLLAGEASSAASLGRVTGAGIRIVGVAALALSLPFLLLRRPAGRTRPELPLALAAGVLFGAGDTLLKVAIEAVRAQLGAPSLWAAGSLGAIARRPEFHLFLLGNAAGLALHQLAYRNGRIALVAPVSAVTSAAIPAALGVALLGEPLGPWRAAGVALLLGGGALIGWPSASAGHSSAPERCPRPTGRITA